ncbi:MAG: hypothetical protein A2275_04965 [Bacteroidetes bacterium RIFOXYA12_FULL_35_11]|nr:MAG: hypothetical protein A2X01_14735 [Bacteroidetes bacterium GWF2_35_48]OFY75936.1 MAG: hypothetical protein A2275_04965 [Bacteroidetes bacterium RIFOXYA12_FULL_35_11]OFY92474.1 MAG: hypothetical protein A2491_10695 [Bacteroidetes bacterium RIFOXYC12_FULL_35_7]OFY96001.1 MAG: hypothetical protein A2309_02510 [Bacteroidetes bacterium RIFOXYB2_FULL_35_7]HBX51551.1 hypothetical protein [Bacteroidales bacterium]
MSEIKKIFYNLFWQNKACQNLFLLSKEELLDTKTLTHEENFTSVSMPRIIISNIENKADFPHETIKLRTENQNIKNESLIESKIELYKPIITNFLENKFGKSLERVVKDFQNDPWKLLGKAALLFIDSGENFEKTIIEFLQEYGFIGKQINSFSELEKYFQKEAITKNFKSVLSENNIWNFLEFLKAAKDIYVFESYKSLYTSNQVLVNALHDKDDFISRLQLFNLLFDSGIISSSNEDAFIECTNCQPGTYRGVFQLKLNPLKLKELKCPVCSGHVSYYVPYELNKEIYEIVKAKDGLLLDALCDLLNKNSVEHKVNQTVLNDIEFDCVYKVNESYSIVECKMYKIDTPKAKLKSKMKEHLGKLISNIVRLKEAEPQNAVPVFPVLLVNINDHKLLNEVEVVIKSGNPDELTQIARICSIDQINFKN